MSLVHDIDGNKIHFRSRLTKIIKEFHQEITIEGLELIRILLFPPNKLQAMSEIVGITIERVWGLRIEETFALDEIDEHQAVKHQRGVPFAVALRGDAGDKLQEGRVF